jgi:hypothetical protein
MARVRPQHLESCNERIPAQTMYGTDAPVDELQEMPLLLPQTPLAILAKIAND